MSTRERWTIYPLLFLALGAALRDKLTASVDSRFVTCEDLEIVDHQGQVQLRLTSHDGASGKLTVFERGDPRVVITSNKAGGAVTAVDNEKNLFITLGHEGTQSGVMAENLKNRASFTARFEPNVVRRLPVQAAPDQAKQPHTAEAHTAEVHPAQQQPAPAAASAGPTANASPAPGWHSGRKIP